MFVRTYSCVLCRQVCGGKCLHRRGSSRRVILLARRPGDPGTVLYKPSAIQLLDAQTRRVSDTSTSMAVMLGSRQFCGTQHTLAGQVDHSLEVSSEP